jgi:uncharacterized protein (TIGR03086 family)
MGLEEIAIWLATGRSEFDRRLEAVAPSDWARSTPCAEWDVRQVVNHVVGQEFRMTALLLGGGLAQYVQTREDDWLGDDPMAAWKQGSAELDSALEDREALGRLVEYRDGPVTGEVLMKVRIFDMAVHAWDLAKGIGADERLDPGLVGWSLDALDGPLAFLWGSPRAASPDASPQERLLRHCGREP